MNEHCRATRAYLKRLSPLDADTYIKSFQLPELHSKIMTLLYVKKIPDIVQATYKLEEEKTFISIFKAGRLHRQALEWISQKIR